MIRKGEKRDLPAVLELIKELALYERAPHEVTNTVEKMEEDGFGANPCYGMLVAEEEGKIVGISIYYTRYSTWKGRMLYLEDIVITESQRGKGIGSQLFAATGKEALAGGYAGMIWQVLEWNEPAINFYKKYGAQLDGEWVNGKLGVGELRELFSGDVII